MIKKYVIGFVVLLNIVLIYKDCYSESYIKINEDNSPIYPGDSYNLLNSSVTQSCLEPSEIEVNSPYASFESEFTEITQNNINQILNDTRFQIVKDKITENYQENYSSRQFLYSFKLSLNYQGLVGGKLSQNIKELIDAENYEEFFRRCGSGFVSEVLRTSRILAIFNVDQFTNEYTEANFKNDLDAFEELSLVFDQNVEDQITELNSRMSQTNLKIKIFGFGLSSWSGQSVLATNVQTFFDAIRSIVGDFKSDKSIPGFPTYIIYRSWVGSEFLSNTPMNKFVRKINTDYLRRLYNGASVFLDNVQNLNNCSQKLSNKYNNNLGYTLPGYSSAEGIKVENKKYFTPMYQQDPNYLGQLFQDISDYMKNVSLDKMFYRMSVCLNNLQSEIDTKVYLLIDECNGLDYEFVMLPNYNQIISSYCDPIIISKE